MRNSMHTRRSEAGHVRHAGPTSLPRAAIQRARRGNRVMRSKAARKKEDGSRGFGYVLVSGI